MPDRHFSIQESCLALRNYKSFGPDLGPFVGVGSVFDPFMTLLNLKCDDSTFWVADGSGMCIRNRRYLARGEEITISKANHPTIALSDNKFCTAATTLSAPATSARSYPSPYQKEVFKRRHRN